MRNVNQIKEIRKMKSSQDVLDQIEIIHKILKEEIHKDIVGLKNDYKSFLRIETIAYKIAIKKAVTTDDFEKIAISLEEDFKGNPYLYDEYLEWSEIVRIMAYGYDWFLKKEFTLPTYQQFVNYSESEGIVNPFASLHLEKNN